MLPLQSSLSRGLFQVAYVVRDIQEAQRFFSQTLGGPRFFVIENITFREYMYRGQPIEARQHTAFGYAGTMQIELIQPVAGENTASELLRQQGMGVHHLGIQVEDFDRAKHEMAGQGFTSIESGIAGQGTHFAMFDTRTAIGSYIELVYLDDANRELFERVRRGDF